MDQLPGMNAEITDRVLRYRDEHGGFMSVGEFLAAADIKPVFAAQLREITFCSQVTGEGRSNQRTHTEEQENNGSRKRGRILDL